MIGSPVGKRLNVTEVRAMLDVIYKNKEVIRTLKPGSLSSCHDAFFGELAAATKGRRSVDYVRAWYYNVKKIREHEKTYTQVMKKAFTSPYDAKVLDSILFPGEKLKPLVKGENKENNSEGMDIENVDRDDFENVDPKDLENLPSALKHMKMDH